MKKYKLSGYSYVYVAEMAKSEIEKVDFALCKQPRETLGSYYNRQSVKPAVMCNGGFFSMSNGNTCFHYIDEGKTISTGYDNVTDGFGVKSNDTDNIVFGNFKDGGWKDFVSAYPVLVKNGVAQTSFPVGSEINYNATRTCLAYNDTTVWVVHIAKPGMKFAAMAKMLKNMGATYAINLDGGGSARMLVNGAVYGKPTENRSVDNVVCFYLKKTTSGGSGSSSGSTGGGTTVPDQGYFTYTAVKGDSWWAIAKKFLGNGAKYTELLAFNGLSANAGLKVGQVVKIPAESKTYTVKSGDSWWSIAAKQMGNGNRYKELASYNGTTISKVLHPGDVLKIPV